jgi:hypothetical protein
VYVDRRLHFVDWGVGRHGVLCPLD